MKDCNEEFVFSVPNFASSSDSTFSLKMEDDFAGSVDLGFCRDPKFFVDDSAVSSRKRPRVVRSLHTTAERN